jgi:hypothetical protein
MLPISVNQVNIRIICVVYHFEGGKMKSDIITSGYNVEVSKMPDLLCAGCKKPMEIEVPHRGYAPNQCNPHRLIGSAICRYCNAGTGFELEDDTIVYVSGKSSYGSLNTALPDIVKTLYAEAELSFQSGAADASAAMCRASIETALAQAGFKDDNLFEQIDSAKTAGDLDDIEVSLAHGSRLITRDAIHRGALIALSDIPSMLSATVRILNKLSTKISP